MTLEHTIKQGVFGLTVSLGLTISASMLATAEQDKTAYGPLLDAIISQSIEPLHMNLASAAVGHAEDIKALCAAPSEHLLGKARDSFDALVSDYAAAAVIRFGPIRVDNRLERLMYWPDPRGRGVKHISAVLRSKDTRALSADTLKQKSVATQGLTAQDYILFGLNADTLANSNAFRCAYAQTNALMIANMAQNMADAWAGPFGRRLRDAHAEDPDYRSHQEVLQKILGSMRETLQLIGDQKLASVLKDAPTKAKPKLGAFWRSDNTINEMLASLSGLREIMADNVWSSFSTDVVNSNLRVFQSELKFAHRTLSSVSQQTDWLSGAQLPEIHEQLLYVVIPVNSAQTVLAEKLLPALGLRIGFNSLDGD